MENGPKPTGRNLCHCFENYIFKMFLLLIRCAWGTIFFEVARTDNALLLYKEEL